MTAMRWFQSSLVVLAASALLVAAAPVYAAEEYGERGSMATEWAAPELVNLNTAAVDQLASVPGISADLALAIVMHRDENGPYSKLEDLLSVKGMSQERLDALRYWVTLE